MDFLEAIDVKTCEVTLAGETFMVEQRKLVDYYRLRTLLDVMTVSGSQKEKLDAIYEYIAVATGVSNLSSVEIDELAPALDSLVSLNTEEVNTLPWQTSVKNIDTEETRTTVDYDHRDLTVIVNLLASAYGWGEEKILNLSPEAAVCYVQEILLDGWKEDEFEYMLSENAYTSKGKYIPYPPLSWYTVIKGPTVKEATMKIPQRLMPIGVIHDITKKSVRDELKAQKEQSQDS